MSVEVEGTDSEIESDELLQIGRDSAIQTRRYTHQPKRHRKHPRDEKEKHEIKRDHKKKKLPIAKGHKSNNRALR